ncbi:MAG: hypothetical protein ACLR77_06015 [Oscillospiraceae bacterium]
MMKQKKIIVPILTLAVMLLMVGGVYAVFLQLNLKKAKLKMFGIPLTKTMKKGLRKNKRHLMN